MPRNILCDNYRKMSNAAVQGYCTHPASPRRLFGKTECVLERENSDPRIKEGCALQTVFVVKRPPPKSP